MCRGTVPAFDHEPELLVRDGHRDGVGKVRELGVGALLQRRHGLGVDTGNLVRAGAALAA
jgi:hypothetical protein